MGVRVRLRVYVMVLGALAAAPALCAVGTELGTDADVPKVVYAGVPDTDAGRELATALVRTVAPQYAANKPVHLATLLGSGELGTWNLAGAQPCAVDPVDPTAYRASLDELVRAYQMVEDTAAPADQLQAQWSCLSAPVTTAELARAPLYRGLGAAADERWDEAREAFREVLVLDTSSAWDDDLEPRAKSCFADAKLELAEVSRTRLRVLAPAGADVWIDGAGVLAPWEGRLVTPGAHLVQVRAAPSDPLAGIVVGTGGEGDGIVVLQAALEPAAFPHAGYHECMTALLEAMTTSGNGAPTLFVLLGPVPAVIRADGTAVISRQGPDRTRVAGGVLMGAGAAVAAGGAALAGSSWSERQRLDADAATGADVGDTWEQEGARYRAGWIVVGVGAVMAAVGLPLLIAGSPDGQDKAAVAVDPGPTGLGLGLHGRF